MIVPDKDVINFFELKENKNMEIKCTDCANQHRCNLQDIRLPGDTCNNFVKDYYATVEHPNHYCSGAHECIDVMESLFGINAVMDFCRCNIFKYHFRADKKNGEEDIKKAEWYESKLMELEKKWKDLYK